MKKIIFSFLTAISFAAGAQKNAFLDQAFWKGNPDIAAVQAEIAKGSNPAEMNRMGFDAVVTAINASASAEAIKFLLEQTGNDVNKLTHDGRTYVFWAANRGNVEVVEYLINKGAKLDIEDTHGSTPLSFAASAGQPNTKVYDALLKGGADVKKKSQEGASVLLLAIPGDKDFNLTNYFISKGLSLKDTDASGNTAFNYAAKTGNIELMKALIQKGVKYNDNAFIMAAQGSRGGNAAGPEVFQYFESLKLKPTAVNGNGENVLHYLARKPNQAELVRYFLAKGVNVNQADKDGNTPLLNAAGTNRDTAVINLLVASVKNINQSNKKGVSPIAMAVKGNSSEVVKLLIDGGAELNIADADGNNLAYYLVQSYTPATTERSGNPRQGTAGSRADDFDAKMQVLQAKGFDVAKPQKDGNNLYHLAVEKNDLALLKMIEPLHLDVNSTNKEGVSALHKAAMIAKDDTILKYLVGIGAKKDVTTEFKETAYDLAKENEYFSKNNISIDFLK